MSRGIADSDRNPDNFLRRIARFEQDLADVKRWAAPVGKRLLPNPPAIAVWRASAQTIPNSTPTVVDTLTIISEEGLELEGTSVIKLRRESESEWYNIWVHAQWASNSTGYRAIGFDVRNVNTGAWVGITPEIRNAIASPDVTYTPLSVLYRMGATDEAIRIKVTQNSGGNLDLQVCLINVVMVKSGDVAAQ